MWEEWVVDATHIDDTLGGSGLWCFIPVERRPEGIAYITGMSLLTSPEGFDQGKVIGVIHADGRKACDVWCDVHKEQLDALTRR